MVAESIKILFDSQHLGAEESAILLVDFLHAHQQEFDSLCNFIVEKCDVQSVVPEDLFSLSNSLNEISTLQHSTNTIIIFLTPTIYEHRELPFLYRWLEDNCTDHRVPPTHLSHVYYTFYKMKQDDNISDSISYIPTTTSSNHTTNTFEDVIQRNLLGLGATHLSLIGPFSSLFSWISNFHNSIINSKIYKHSQIEKIEAEDLEEESDDDEEEVLDFFQDLDIEDLLAPAPARPIKITPVPIVVEEKEEKNLLPSMITPKIHASLLKQGYRVVGTHSSIKLCRWAKSMLRGRGGCYKHTFYGISSHQCMEMTCSLACANKCSFCWRHHTNPTGRSWTWRSDNPEFLYKEFLVNQRKLVNSFRGVPGVTEEGLTQGSHPRHCALSLVGEPIMYPELNGFLSLLHQNRFTTFLVTNAQFPEQLRQTSPVTQLYLSLDAATPEELKRIDRPLFPDYWQRLLDCVTILATRPERTVFRLTLINDENMSDESISEYARIMLLGNPDFIEIKGVTYCGKTKSKKQGISSGSSNNEHSKQKPLQDVIAMSSVPYYPLIVSFCEQLSEALGDEYDIACEHEHSLCILIAHKKFCIEGKWHTWIDFDRFFQLHSTDSINAIDYMAPTPDWALFGSSEQGFDPYHTRYHKPNSKKRPYLIDDKK